MNNRLIVLAGPPCSGKSSAGAILSELLGADFIEIDREIEMFTGMSIPAFFQTAGEPAFRSIEKQVIMKVIKAGGFAVVALGGGSLMDGETRTMVEKMTRMFTLTAPAAALAARNTGGRPLSADPEAMTALLESRADHYSSLGNTIDTQGKTPIEVARHIAEVLRKEDHSRWFRQDLP